MATSGSFATGSYTDSGITRYLLFSWERTGYSIAENTSTISWSLTGAGSSGWMMCGGFTVVIDGETVYSKGTNYRVQVYSGTVIASGTKTIHHNTDGSRSFSASAAAGIYSYAVNKSGSGSWSLDNIPRQATLTNAPNFNDEENPTITYSNLAGNSVSSLQACISLTGGADDVAYREISKTGSSYTFNLTEAERNKLRTATTGGNSRTVYFYIKTVIGGGNYLSSLGKTFTIINGTPTLSPTAEDKGGVSSVLTGDGGKILIKGYNTLYVNTGATARKGAILTGYAITCGGKSLSTASGILDHVESGTIVFSATDNRGNTTTATLTKTLVDYTRLTCNLTANAPTTDGVLNFSVNGNYFSGSFGAVDNTLSVVVRYKENGGDWSEWAAVTPEISGNTYTAPGALSGLDYQNAYTVQAIAYDRIYTGGVESEEKKVKTTPVFDWGENDFNFNVPATVNGKPLVYVEDEGANGIWHYVKYSNGVAECWGSKTVTADVTGAWGSLYSSGGVYDTMVNFPFSFVDVPAVAASLSGSGVGGWLMMTGNVNEPTTKTHTGIYEFARGTAREGASFTINFIVKGRWK